MFTSKLKTIQDIKMKRKEEEAASVLIFSVTGTDNNGDIFGIQRTNRTSTGAGSTGSMTVAVLELRDTVPIDYEGKQLYTYQCQRHFYYHSYYTFHA